MQPEKNYNYAFIGNCTTGALVNKDCSIDWLCMPFFDSPSVFAKIIDEKSGGFFRISAENCKEVRQTYLYYTPILMTTFETQDGIFEVRDYMPRFAAGVDVYCPPEIHRTIRVVSGKPKIRIQLDPRPNYAQGKTTCIKKDEYLKFMSQEGPYNSFYLYSNLDFDAICKGDVMELEGAAYFVLSYHEKLEEITHDKTYIEYEKTKSYWLDWVSRTNLPEKYREHAIRSLITLKLLMFQRTGAVIAAPTTSLPETIGEGRNWDYRFCWVRDASMIIDLFFRMGHKRTSSKFIAFILNRMMLKHENIGVMYGINGEEKLTEKELDHLAGYEGSKPVRIGNAAYKQRQNDIYGELIETIYTSFVINAHGARPIDEEVWTVVRSLVNRVLAIWKEPDCGIWERRDGLKHYVHSKLMSWVAMDRAVKIAKFVGKDEYCVEFQIVADEIREDILKNGWDPKLGSFVMAYGEKELDAANLLMLHYGFLPADDKRIRSTVTKTYEVLMRDGFLLRYSGNDGFGKPHNAFLVCSFWMTNALFLIGQKAQARELFERLVSHANPFGLIAEDLEPKTGRLTGNFPQGYSHLALVQSLCVLEMGYDWSQGDIQLNF